MTWRQRLPPREKASTVAPAKTDDEIRHDLAETIQATLDNCISNEDDPFWRFRKRMGQRPHFIDDE